MDIGNECICGTTSVARFMRQTELQRNLNAAVEDLNEAQDDMEAKLHAPLFET